MGNALVAYLAAAVAAASHAAAPPNGATAALAARPRHTSVVLRARPNGPRLVKVGPRGPLGGPLVFGVVGVRGRWVKVTAEALPNGHYGWVRFGRDVSVQPVEWALRASLSRRALYVLRDGRLVRTIPVGIGAPDSPTPTGRFAVAEKVTGSFGPAYGCCILALTARQPHLPPGWNSRRGPRGPSGVIAALTPLRPVMISRAADAPPRFVEPRTVWKPSLSMTWVMSSPSLLRLMRGQVASLVTGQRVLPNKALSNGFVFRHETLRSAFEAIL
jgi:hypothetical protein